MSVVAELEERVVVEAWPRLRSCARCGGRVLLARGVHQGHPFVLEPREVFPIGACTRCRGSGSVRVEIAVCGMRRGGGRWSSVEPGDLVGRTSWVQGDRCPSCAGSGLRGEPVPARVVAVAASGVARRLGPGEERRTGEALHRPHRC